MEQTKPQIINTKLGKIECLVRGEGEPVLAIHGAMGGYDQSYILARTVGDPSYKYISVSRPGYLNTPINSGQTGEQQADLLAALLDEMKIPKAFVIAISGGGYSAINFAIKYKDRCRGLILISTLGTKNDKSIPFVFNIMKLIARIPFFSNMIKKKTESDFEKAARPSIADEQTRLRVLGDPEVAPLFKELMSSTVDRMNLRIKGTENDIRITQNAEYDLEGIAAPTLIVHGTKDQVASYDPQALVLNDRIPNSELLTIKGGEHVSIFTHRNEVQTKVTEFLRNVK